IVEALTPEGSVEFEPVEQWRKATRLRPVAHVAALTTLGHQSRSLQRAQVLGNGGLGHGASPHQLTDGDVAGTGDRLEDGAPGGIGEGLHEAGDAKRLGHEIHISYYLCKCQCSSCVHWRAHGLTRP